jgi:hypothetical protein
LNASTGSLPVLSLDLRQRGLTNAEGHALLGDFGAASPLPPETSPICEALVALDRRALGVLQAELELRMA